MNRIDMIIGEFKTYKNSLNPKLVDRIFPKDDRVRLKNIEALTIGILFIPIPGVVIVLEGMLTEEVKTVNLLIITILMTMAIQSIWIIFFHSIINDLVRGLIGPKFYRQYVQVVYRKVFERDKLMLKKIIENQNLDLEIICKRIEYRSKECTKSRFSFSYLMSITSFSISLFTIINTNFQYIIEFVRKHFVILDKNNVLAFLFFFLFGIALYFFMIFQNDILYFGNTDYYLYKLVEEILYCDLRKDPENPQKGVRYCEYNIKNKGNYQKKQVKGNKGKRCQEP